MIILIESMKKLRHDVFNYMNRGSMFYIWKGRGV